MSAHNALSDVDQTTHAAPSQNPAFPTFRRMAKLFGSSFSGPQQLIREYPSLTLVAVAMISLVIVLKGLTLRATIQDAAVGDWLRACGGGCNSSGDSGHLIISIMSEIFARRVMQGRLISMVTIPVPVANNQHEQLFLQLSKLSRLQSVYFTSDYNGAFQQMYGAAPIAAPGAVREKIDSRLLHQGLASLHHAVTLSISNADLAPCDNPLDLTGKLNSVSLQNVHITRDFAMGLPIVKRCSYVMLHNSQIDDDAVDILLERLNSSQMYIYSTSMSAATQARLSATKGVSVIAQTIVVAKTAGAPNSAQAPAEKAVGPSAVNNSSSAPGSPAATAASDSSNPASKSATPSSTQP